MPATSAPVSSASAAPRRRGSVRHRAEVVARAFAALLGGYALASLSAAALALALPGPRDEAVILAALPSFLVLTGAAVWAFAARSAARAWLGLGLPALVLALFVWGLRAASATP